MRIICSTATELGLTVGKRIINKGIYIFGKVPHSNLQIMLCLKSWSFLCIYRKLNQGLPCASICSGNDLPAFCV